MVPTAFLRRALALLTTVCLLAALGAEDAHAGGWSLKKARRSIQKRVKKTHARVAKHAKRTGRSIDKHTRKAGRSIDKTAHSAARHLGFGFKRAKRTVQTASPVGGSPTAGAKAAPAADC